MIIQILKEAYQLAFIMSIIFLVHIVIDISVKAYSKIKMGNDTKFILSVYEKLILWFSIGIFLSYIF
jgi:hypothetical protein